LQFESNTLKLKGRVVFQKLQVPTFERLPKVYHENEACFIFVNQGGFQIRSQVEILQLNKETALLAKCLNYFYETIKKPSETNDNVEVIGIMLYPELIKSLFDFDISISNHKVDFNLKQVQVNKLLEHYRDSIKILLENPELADEELIKNKLREFIILMTKTINAPSELDFLAAMFKPNFAKFEEIIQSNLYANLSIDELANLCHMSLSTFKRKFNEVYNESPLKYFTKLKVIKAIALLKNKELRISDIAHDLGFETPTTFNRVFKQQTGKNPSEYRMSLFD
jgi:AraC family transcriptional regulator, exoenzyme S synthesis regulatory protein ExsA